MIHAPATVLRRWMNAVTLCEADAGTIIRPAGWDAANDVPHTWSQAGRLYRGMSDAEFRATVGAGKGVMSDSRYCAPGEGTCFSDDAADAESHVNFGRTDPRKTHQPTYVVEIDAADIRRDRDGYWKTPSVPPDQVRRVWRMEPHGAAVIAHLIKH